jgi:hypothetical protein
MELVRLKRRYFLRWTKDEADLPPGVESVFTEVDTKGEVLREIGLDDRGERVYTRPSDHPVWGRDGVFHRVDLPPSAKEIGEEAFEMLWRGQGEPYP